MPNPLKDIESILNNIPDRPGLRALPIHLQGAVLDYYKTRPLDQADLHNEMIKAVQGIKAYLQHPYRRTALMPAPFWQEGQTRLYAYPAFGKKATGPALLLIPSLINRSYIFDLKEDKSFVQWLRRQGCNIYILDWGEAKADPGLGCLDHLLRQRLYPALAALAAEEPHFFALGYCMGGTLLALAAGANYRDEYLSFQDRLKGLIFLAAPWDFHAGNRMLADHIAAGQLSAMELINDYGYLPARWVQSVFAAVNADKLMAKFSRFSEFPSASAEAELFVAVEDWVNDGVDLPGAVAKAAIRDWYGQNKLCQDYSLSVSVEKLPKLVVAAGRDRLVPRESALALTSCLPGAETIEADIGHVGMMVGRQAEKQVWEPVFKWLVKRSEC